MKVTKFGDPAINISKNTAKKLRISILKSSNEIYV